MSGLFPTGVLASSALCPGLYTTRLDNGLRVIIRENHRAPVAICNVWVAAGSNREPDPVRGWSHGIEHMLFKGTQRRGEGDFAREVAEAGGSTNAGTGYESTNYHITLPADRLPVAVDILADALFHSAFAPAALDAEREVLVHENHMYDDVPFGYGVTWRWGLEAAFDVSPYRHPIGGPDRNLRERSRDEIMAYWRSAYRPENMIAVVVGDCEAAAALAVVREKFGDVTVAPAGGPCAILDAPPTEPPHDAPRLRVERGDITKCYAKLIFPAPGDRDDPAQVMGVIRQILAEGRTSRLYHEIQEKKKLIDDFTVMGEAGPREGVFIIDLETDADRLVPAVQAVCAILEDLKKTGGGEEELARARMRVLRGFHFGAETVQGQAALMGRYALLGDLPGAFAFPARVAGVTRADVAAMAARVFGRDQVTAMVYLPEQETPADMPGDGRELDALLETILGNDADIGTGPAPEGAAAAAPDTARAGEGAEPFTTVRLGCGVEASYRVDRTLPVVALAVTSAGGACTETAALSGLNALRAAVQVKAAAGRDAVDLHGELEAAGAAISPVTDRDYGGLVLSGLSAHLDGPLDRLADLIHRPDFPDHEIDQERRLALEELASLQDNPLQLGVVRLRALLYGDHPYGRPLVGTPESLPRLTREQVLRAHREAWNRGRIRITLAGDFEPDSLLPRLDAMLTGLPGDPWAIPQVAPPRSLDGIERERLDRRINQCVLLLGWPGPRTPDQMRPARMLLKEVLNGQSGRLFEELRNRRSLCYNTGLMTTAGFGQGMVLAYVLTAPESEAEARTTLLTELARIVSEPVDEREIDRARAKLRGNLAISLQSNFSRASRALRNRIYGREADDLPALLEALDQVQPADIREAAAAWLDPDRRCEVVVSPGS